MNNFFLRRILSNLSITQKMMIVFIMCFFVPFIIQNVFYLNATEQKIQEEMIQRLKISLIGKENKINGSITGTVSLALRYSTNEGIYSFLDTDYDDKIDWFIDYLNRKNLMETDMAYNQQIVQMMFYTQNPTLVNGAFIRKIGSDEINTFGENLRDFKTYELSQKVNGPSLRISVASKISNDRSLSVIKPLTYFPQYSKYYKTLRVDIDLPYLSTMLREKDMFDNIVLVDTDGRILASANTYSEYGDFDIFDESKLKRGTVVLKQQLQDAPLYLYGFYDSSIISKEFNFMRFKNIVIAFGSMIIALFFFFLVASNITKRTKLVVNLSKNIAKGNFEQISEDQIGKDEIGALAASINQMSIQLQNLIEKEFNSRLTKLKLERETTQAKLLALQSQVDPHFMFNALECIRLKAIVKNEMETGKIIMYLSKMFRHLISWDDDIISLRDDLKFIEEFLYIQKYRFDDEFEYKFFVDRKAYDCYLPKLIVQPLIENACVHGVESISYNRKVNIKVEIINNQLVVTVSDNGIGIDNKRLEEIKAMFNNSGKLDHSVGLYNVYQRLLLYYGENFSMDINSSKNKGTLITIKIPVRYSKEEF